MMKIQVRPFCRHKPLADYRPSYRLDMTAFMVARSQPFRSDVLTAEEYCVVNCVEGGRNVE